MGGWLGAIGSMFSWLGGEGIGASLARIAIGLGISKLLNKTNESAAGSSSASTPQGTRQQIAAATDNKIPVAYGDSYFSGTVVDQRTINDNKETVVVLDLCELTGDIFSTNPTVPGSRTASDIIIDAIYLNNQLITFKADGTTIDYTTDDTGVHDTNAQGLCGIYLFKGSSNAPMLPCAINTRTPISGTVPPVAYEIMPGWDNTYTNQNKIFALVKMNYDPSKGLHALPEFKFHVRNTMNKVGDCLHDYMTNVMYGAGLPEALVDNASITALNTYGDESVTLGSYPAQPRYRINGLIRTTETNLSNMEKLAAAGGAMISYDLGTGKFSVVVNKLVSKTLEFDDSNILGGISLNSTDLTAAYNKVEVQFPYKVLKDQYNYVRFDLPEIYRNANEPDNTMQITHEFVNDPVQATILANLDLRQSREDHSITFKTDYSKYNVAIGAVIGVTNSVYGWNSKQFKVIRIRRNESDSGQLTIEITAQAYNADVYTVEDISDFVPLIGAGHSLPALTAIQRPLAPTVTSSTLSSQPSVSITGIIPDGLVTLLEFWQTTDTGADTDATPYTLIGSMRPENGGLFTIGDVVTFRTVELRSGTYRFKVRASYNGTSTSRFSPPSTSLAYTYVQAPDVLKYTTPSVGEDGEVDEDSINYGMLAAYAGYKIFEKPITDYLKEKYGLTDEEAEKAAASVAKDNAASTNATEAITKADGAVGQATAAQTAAAQASQDAAAASLKADQALAAAQAAGGNIADVTMTSTLTGQVFPSVFGSGPTYDANTHAGIFTHDNLVFAGSVIAAPTFIANNVVSGTKTLHPSIKGKIQNFYTIPNSAGWAKPPQYTQTVTDKFDYDSTLSLYYATATYTSGNLDEQSWSNWTLLSSGNGVTGAAKGTAVVTTTYTNPYVEIIDPYVVDAIYEVDGFGNVVLNKSADYDPFLPNVAVTSTTYTPDDTRKKELTITVNGTKSFVGSGANLIIFGTSTFKLPDGTPFAGNTAFGHIAPVYRVAYPNALSFTSIVNNGSRFVAIETTKDRAYWSDDGYTWTRIALPNEVTTDETWLQNDLLEPQIEKFSKENKNNQSNLENLQERYLLAVADTATSITDHKMIADNPATTSKELSDSQDKMSDTKKAELALLSQIKSITNKQPSNSLIMASFEFIIWDGTKFMLYDLFKGVAMSNDGKTWVEDVSTIGIDKFTRSVIGDSGHYLAVGDGGIQTSADGIDWTPVAMPSEFEGQPAYCACWDGSKFLVGSKYNAGQGSAVWSSTDGSSWAKLSNLNDPNATQSISAANNATTNLNVSLISGMSSAGF